MLVLVTIAVLTYWFITMDMDFVNMTSFERFSFAYMVIAVVILSIPLYLLLKTYKKI